MGTWGRFHWQFKPIPSEYRYFLMLHGFSTGLRPIWTTGNAADASPLSFRLSGRPWRCSCVSCTFPRTPCGICLRVLHLLEWRSEVASTYQWLENHVIVLPQVPWWASYKVSSMSAYDGPYSERNRMVYWLQGLYLPKSPIAWLAS